MPTERIAILAVAAALAVVAPRAVAQPVLPPVDRAYVAAGVYDARNGLSGRWDASEASLGTSFDFRRDLGFAGQEWTPVYAVGGSLGAERAHKLDAFAYGYDDASRRSLARELRIEDDVFPVGGRFAGSLDIDLVGASYTWMFHRRERHAAGIGLGLVQYDVDGVLALEAGDGSQTLAVRNVLVTQAIAPMLRGEYVRTLGERWRAGAAVSYIRADGGDVSGDAIDAHVRLEWFPAERFGLALRYNLNELDFDFDRRRFTGNIDVENHGLQLLAMLRH